MIKSHILNKRFTKKENDEGKKIITTHANLYEFDEWIPYNMQMFFQEVVDRYRTIATTKDEELK